MGYPQNKLFYPGQKVFWFNEEVVIVRRSKRGTCKEQRHGFFWRVLRPAFGPCRLIPEGGPAREQDIFEDGLTHVPDHSLTALVDDYLKGKAN